MSIRETVKIAWRAIYGNKVRTSLTVLGVVIGIASVIIVYSAGEGIRGLIVGQVESFGTDILEVEIKVPNNKKGTSADAQSGSAMAQGVQVTTLTLDDVREIDKMPNVKRSYAGIMGQEQVAYGSETAKGFILGTNSTYIDIDQSEIDTGRFFTDAEDKSLAQVVVLGAKIKNTLFGDSDPTDKTIRIRKGKYRVIGVMKERGAMMGMDFDNYLYLPIRTLQKRVMGINHVLYVVSQLNDLSQADSTAEDIRYLLRERHDITDPAKDDFRVSTMAEMMATLETITGAITLLLLAIVAISLVVGGVGIMNIMYVVVTERTAEIGLRKAIGATYSDIMWQFLIESVVVTFIGGVVGVLFGILMAGLIYFGANAYGFDWEFAVPLKAFIVSIGFSLFFGIIFGLYPARKAAKMTPIEALRTE